MNHLNDKNFIRKHDQIKQEIVLNDTYKTNGKQTQSESQFQGVFLADSKIKLLWVLAFLGPVGLILPFFISNRKEYVSKDKKDYYYCDISRAKAENIAIFALIISIAYSLIFYYYFQDVSAKELDKKYREEQMINQ